MFSRGTVTCVWGSIYFASIKIAKERTAEKSFVVPFPGWVGPPQYCGPVRCRTVIMCDSFYNHLTTFYFNIHSSIASLLSFSGWFE